MLISNSPYSFKEKRHHIRAQSFSWVDLEYYQESIDISDSIPRINRLKNDRSQALKQLSLGISQSDI